MQLLQQQQQQQGNLLQIVALICLWSAREFFNKRTMHKYVKASMEQLLRFLPASVCCFVIERELISSSCSSRRSSPSCISVGVTAPRGVTAAWLEGFEASRRRNSVPRSPHVARLGILKCWSILCVAYLYGHNYSAHERGDTPRHQLCDWNGLREWERGHCQVVRWIAG